MRKHALTLLRQGVNSATADFRPGQWEAVQALLQRKRLLVVQRTGWGKSIVYFLATKLLRENGAGFTLLISPLLALMRNQIEAAQRIGIHAETINSTNQKEWSRVQNALQQNAVDVLLISPERLGNDDFLRNCLLPVAGRVGLLVVDEAHCISDWGHDFRPDYMRIVRVLKALPGNVPVLATTATANDRVVADIQQQLGPHLQTIRGSLARQSLRLQNLNIRSKAARMAWVANQVPRLPGSGIIYTLTIHDAERLAAWLQSRGIDAAAYYGDMETEVREALEQRLLQNQVKALVATVALGMGFDKPDLGFVIHFQRPASVVHYYQQVGRAGRAMDKAYGLLLGGAEDDEIADYFISNAFPTDDEVTQVLAALRSSAAPLKPFALKQQVNLPGGKLNAALKFLLLESPAPIQKTDEGYALNPVRWQMPTGRIERLNGLRRKEQDRMREYLLTKTCLMHFLSTELNDPQAAPCGRCANCRGLGLKPDVPQELLEAAASFLNTRDLPIEPRKRWPGGMTFEGASGVIPPEQQIQAGRALCRWGDPGLGDLIREGKQQTGNFSDRLVEAAAQFIQQRWDPQPGPQWVTCVPSRRNRFLVCGLARRIAAVLGLPFVECLRTIRQIEPQKTRRNTYQQLRNLENAFAADANLVRPSAVLLVDDMVDSKWTFTVVGFKLLEAGSGPVFPFALADASVGDRE